MPLAVFISHSGKTVELEVGPHARVDAVQQTLASLTGIPQVDQILMCEGARLDAAKPLSAYGLPGAEQEKVHDLFLYSRAHLRADAPPPPPETLPDCPMDLSGMEDIRQQRHRLDSAGSPLLRALPDYQRQFQQHLLQANAAHEASQQRLATCARLVSEQEVQALSIDAATANVELHYAYICDAYGAFMTRFQQQHAAHADILARFESDLSYLASTELHPGLQPAVTASVGSGSSGGGGAAPGGPTVGSPQHPTHLIHLVNADALREAAAACARGHQHFGGKVSELEALFAMLKADVEALFMQAPSVDLEALTRQLEEVHVQVDEQASIVAALSSDLSKVQQLLEHTSEQLTSAAADPGASVQVSDTVHMLETMHETHVGHLLPRVLGCHAAVESFAAQCLDCKNALTRDVWAQLRTISSQQSKIREMKNKLALFREALARQEGAVQDLLVVRRVPAAYKQCLAECVRRDAFMEKYAHSAAQLAERMGNFREKELGMRDSFRKHVERLIPPNLLERMGLLEQPPHCQVSVSASEGERLLPVTVDDVRRIQLPWGTASVLGPSPSSQPATPTAAAVAAGAGAPAAQQPSFSGEQQQEAAAAAAAEVDVTASLQLENARLRAELASQIALDCIRSAQLVGLGLGLGGSVATLRPTPAPGQSGAAAAGQAPGQASQQLGLSATSPKAAVGGPAGSGSIMAAAVGAAQGGAAALPAVLPDAAQRFERALAAKDSLAAELSSQLGASRQQSAAYEARIEHLEAQLAAMAAAARDSSRHSAAAAAEAASAAAPVAAAQQPATASTSASGSAMSSLLRSASSAAGSASSASASAAIAGTAAVAPAVPAALPVAASMAQAQAAPAPQAPDLSASIEAAGGSSFAGSLRAPDVSRSLGATTSLSTSPPASQPHTVQAMQHPLQQQQQQAQQAEAAEAVQPAAHPAPQPAASWGRASGGEVQLISTVTHPLAGSVDSSSQPSKLTPAPVGAGAAAVPAAGGGQAGASEVHAVPEQQEQAGEAAPQAASSASLASSAPEGGLSASIPPEEGLAAPGPLPLLASTDAEAEAEEGAQAAAQAQQQDQAAPAVEAAQPSSAVAPMPGVAPPAEQPLQPSSSLLAPAVAPPPQLLASMVVDEGSDVEGIEPVTDSDTEEEPEAGAGPVAGAEAGGGAGLEGGEAAHGPQGQAQPDADPQLESQPAGQPVPQLEAVAEESPEADQGPAPEAAGGVAAGSGYCSDGSDGGGPTDGSVGGGYDSACSHPNSQSMSQSASLAELYERGEEAQ